MPVLVLLVRTTDPLIDLLASHNVCHNLVVLDLVGKLSIACAFRHGQRLCGSFALGCALTFVGLRLLGHYLKAYLFWCLLVIRRHGCSAAVQ